MACHLFCQSRGRFHETLDLLFLLLKSLLRLIERLGARCHLRGQGFKPVQKLREFGGHPLLKRLQRLLHDLLIGTALWRETGDHLVWGARRRFPGCAALHRESVVQSL